MSGKAELINKKVSKISKRSGKHNPSTVQLCMSGQHFQFYVHTKMFYQPEKQILGQTIISILSWFGYDYHQICEDHVERLVKQYSSFHFTKPSFLVPVEISGEVSSTKGNLVLQVEIDLPFHYPHSAPIVKVQPKTVKSYLMNEYLREWTENSDILTLVKILQEENSVDVKTVEEEKKVMKVEVNGREIDVLEKVKDDLLCVICLQLMCDAVELECGHGLCEPCHNNLQQSSIQRNVRACCPKCRVECNANQTRPNRMIRRLVWSLVVLCANESKGCEWKGELSNLKDHLQINCMSEDIQCSLNGCEENVPRKNMDAHVNYCQFRIINCQFCKMEITFKNTKVHEDSCDDCPVPCPSGCGLSSPRNKVPHHITTCPMHVIQCMFQSVGCNARVRRQEMQKHVSKAGNDHMVLLLDDLKEKTKVIDDLQMELTKTKLEVVRTKLELARVKEDLVARPRRNEWGIDPYSSNPYNSY